jgi:hypothetical protein
MSLCYWSINGIGIRAKEIVPYLDKNKLINFLASQFPDDEDISEIYSNPNSFDFDINDFLYGEPFDNLADLLTHCDDTDSMTYGDDGEGGSYFYYPPCMPWEVTNNSPHTVEEVHNRIVLAVQKIATLTQEQIIDMIDDDIHVVGCG